jgi:hypothetical protein
MKRVIILLMISALFCSTQLWGQEKNQSAVGAASGNTAVKGGTYLAPAKTYVVKVTPQTGDLQNANTSNRAPANSDVTTKTNTPENKSAGNEVTAKTGTPENAGTANNVSVTNQQLPSDFPTYINTGNPEKDAETYAKAKQEWISKNPEKYQQMLNPTK